MNQKIYYRNECYLIQGAIFKVYTQIGCGFSEVIYQECLEIEFKKQNIPFIAQPKLSINYNGQTLSHYFKPDFICNNSIILELKAISNLTELHKFQVINYLKASGFKLGILVNFGSFPKTEIMRILA